MTMQALTVDPSVPVKPDVISPVGDLFPNFRWDQSTDPDLPTPDDLLYDMEIWKFDDQGQPTLKATIDNIDGHYHVIPGSYIDGSFQMLSGVFFEYTTALMGGSYLARIKAIDPIHHEESPSWSDFREFRIVFHSIDPSKIYVSTPVFEDPRLGQARFYDPAVQALYELLVRTATFHLGD